MKGFFDTVEALLASGYAVSTEAAATADAAALTEAAPRGAVIIRGMIEGGGLVAAVLAARDVLRISAAVMGEGAPERESIEDEDIPTLAEVFEPCFGGGIGSLKELFGEELTLSGFSIARLDAATARAAFEDMGNRGFQAAFRFEADAGVSGRGLLAAAQSLTQLLPQAPAGGEPESRTEMDQAELSPQEMEDILSGFDDESPGGPEAATRYDSGRGAAEGAQAPPANLDMVLDINLTCVARLGRVEMPISELLSLGPGSIVEVGKLVDEPVELLVNDRLIARGEVVVVDEKFGLRITEIISRADRIRSLS